MIDVAPIKTIEIKGNDNVRVAIRLAGETEADGYTVGYESKLPDGTWLRGDTGFVLTLQEAEASAAWLSKKPLPCRDCAPVIEPAPSYDTLRERLRATKRDLAVAQMQQVAGIVMRSILELNPPAPGPGIIDSILPVITKGFESMRQEKAGSGPFAGFDEAQIDVLRDLADKYGTHTEECPARETGSTEKCTCGWDDLETTLFGEPGAPRDGGVRGKPYTAAAQAASDDDDDDEGAGGSGDEGVAT